MPVTINNDVHCLAQQFHQSIDLSMNEINKRPHGHCNRGRALSIISRTRRFYWPEPPLPIPQTNIKSTISPLSEKQQHRQETKFQQNSELNQSNSPVFRSISNHGQAQMKDIQGIEYQRNIEINQSNSSIFRSISHSGQAEMKDVKEHEYQGNIELNQSNSPVFQSISGYRNVQIKIVTGNEYQRNIELNQSNSRLFRSISNNGQAEMKDIQDDEYQRTIELIQSNSPVFQSLSGYRNVQMKIVTDDEYQQTIELSQSNSSIFRSISNNGQGKMKDVKGNEYQRNIGLDQSNSLLFRSISNHGQAQMKDVKGIEYEQNIEMNQSNSPVFQSLSGHGQAQMKDIQGIEYEQNIEMNQSNSPVFRLLTGHGQAEMKDIQGNEYERNIEMNQSNLSIFRSISHSGQGEMKDVKEDEFDENSELNESKSSFLRVLSDNDNGEMNIAKEHDFQEGYLCDRLSSLCGRKYLCRSEIEMEIMLMIKDILGMETNESNEILLIGDGYCHLDILFDKLNRPNQSISDYLDHNYRLYSYGIDIQYLLQIYSTPFHIKPDNWTKFSEYLQHKSVYGVCGIHAMFSHQYDLVLELNLRRSLSNERIVAVGEIGARHPSIHLQKRAFVNQLQLAKEMNLPVMVISKNSFIETLQILIEVLDSEYFILWRNFEYTKVELNMLKAKFRNIYFNCSPYHLTNLRLQKMVEQVEMSKIIPESVAPHLSIPECPNIWETHPIFVARIYKLLAEMFHQSLREVSNQLVQNIKTFYRIQ